MSSGYDAVVVGCGIAGAATAYYLAKAGLSVAVFERDRPASGGTGYSAAIVRQHYSTPLMARLAKAAMEILRDAPTDLGRDTGYRQVGYLFLAPPDAVEAARRNVEMQQGLGIATQMLEPAEFAERCPWLNADGVAGIAHEPDGGYADPEMATNAFMDAAEGLGATLVARTAVRGLLRDGDTITGVLTDAGEVRAGVTVNAAGPWASPLAASAGLELRMKTVREQDTVWEARPNRPLPESSISDAVDAIYIRPLGDRRYIVGRGFPKTYTEVDPYNYKRSVDDDFVADVQRRLELRIPSFAGAKLLNSYAALYDVSVDWYQYVGPRKGLKGYADFSGGSGHGFKVAPSIARELAAWLTTNEVAEDFRRLSYDRVGRGELFVQSYGGNRG